MRGYPLHTASATYQSKLATRGEPWDLALALWQPSYVDPYAYINQLDARYIGGTNFLRFNSRKLDQLVRQAARMTLGADPAGVRSAGCPARSGHRADRRGRLPEGADARLQPRRLRRPSPGARPDGRLPQVAERRPPAQPAARRATPERALARSRAAPTKSRKSGAGRTGRDLNSGWNWLATNHGWSGSSTISLEPSSYSDPDRLRRPQRMSCGRRWLFTSVAVAVPLVDSAPCRGSVPRSPRQLDPCAPRRDQSARGPRDLLLLEQEVDYRIWRLGIHLRRVGSLQSDTSRRTPRRRRACRGRCRGTGCPAPSRRGRRGSSLPATRAKPSRQEHRPPSLSSRSASSSGMSASTQRR